MLTFILLNSASFALSLFRVHFRIAHSVLRIPSSSLQIFPHWFSFRIGNSFLIGCEVLKDRIWQGSGSLLSHAAGRF